MQGTAARSMSEERRIEPRPPPWSPVMDAITATSAWRTSALLLDAIHERMVVPPTLRRRQYRIAGADAAFKEFQLRTRGIDCTAEDFAVFATRCVGLFGAVHADGVPSGPKARQTMSVIAFPSLYALAAAVGIDATSADKFVTRWHVVSRTGERYVMTTGASYKTGAQGTGRCVLLHGNVPIGCTTTNTPVSSECLHIDDLRWADGDWALPFTTVSSRTTCMCKHWRPDTAPITDFSHACRIEWYARTPAGGYKQRLTAGPIRAVLPSVRIRGESVTEALRTGRHSNEK